MNDSADDERAAIRETTLGRTVRRAVTEHLRILLAAGWRREQVATLAEQALGDAVVDQLTRASVRRASGLPSGR